jgi:hypothetical protein
MSCSQQASAFMSESAKKPPNWASDWIDQQRKKFEQHGARSDAAEDPVDVFGTFFQNFAKGLQVPPYAGDVQGFGPALGLMREHEQAWRDLAEAQAQYRQLESELLSQLNAVQLEALALLEHRVRERGPSESIKEMRELYDLWVECGEEVYARCVRAEPYCKAQAALANAASELRRRQQVILERALRLFDLPTRSEVNSIHRQLRELKERIDQFSSARGAPARSAKASSSKTRSAKSRSLKTRSAKNRVANARGAKASRRKTTARRKT